VLLQADTQLIATEIRDYPEWHKGRSDYGLWYIEIDQPELIQYLDEIQTQFSDLLLPAQQRQYHITLFVCGFLQPSLISTMTIFRFNNYSSRSNRLKHYSSNF
jgi:hypothetical protein